MSRFTPKDLQNSINHLNECLAHGISGYLFVNMPRNNMQAVDLHYVDSEGKLHNSGMAGAGSSREAYGEMWRVYQDRHGTIYHHETKTRKMAKTMLSRSGLINFNLDVCRLSQSQLIVLSDWAKATKYRKSRTSSHSTGAAFYIHLQKRVKI